MEKTNKKLRTNLEKPTVLFLNNCNACGCDRIANNFVYIYITFGGGLRYTMTHTVCFERFSEHFLPPDLRSGSFNRLWTRDTKKCGKIAKRILYLFFAWQFV